jgi:hypothetical protein
LKPFFSKEDRPDNRQLEFFNAVSLRLSIMVNAANMADLAKGSLPVIEQPKQNAIQIAPVTEQATIRLEEVGQPSELSQLELAQRAVAEAREALEKAA